MRSTNSPLHWPAETWAILSLRLFLGFRFLLTGFGKFAEGVGGYLNGFVAGTVAEFAEKTWIPGFLVYPYCVALGPVQILLGAAVLLGIKTRVALGLTALTYFSLAFGKMAMHEHDSVVGIGTQFLIAIVALCLVRFNRFALVQDSEPATR
ncbi:MAG: hypothetical protein SFU53_07400 [Terrimicrobiaceae bacterium]|nr:hypothetical protein [Terrimicrobiaceae bacterium]